MFFFKNSNHSSHDANILNLTDFCKGLAIVLVFLNHYKKDWFGWQGVHIFIILSGLGLAYSCLTKNENPYSKYWYLKRTKKLFSAYWLVLLALLITGILNELYLNKGLMPTAVASLKLLVKRVFLDFLLLRNCFEGFFYESPASFWFIPFIVSCYLCFPWIFNYLKKYYNTKKYILVVLLLINFEFAYRAIAIYFFDGLPVGYDQHFFFDFIPKLVFASNNLPDKIFGMPSPFTGTALFGFFPARIAEFTLGIIIAFGLVKNRCNWHKTLLSPYMGLIGIVVWATGQALLYLGLWGWIFADFVIAIGLILFILNIAYFFQRTIPIFFKIMSWLGIWSYYVYLSHEPILLFYRQVENMLASNHQLLKNEYILLMFGLSVLSVCIASFSLVKLEKRKFFEPVFQKALKIF